MRDKNDFKQSDYKQSEFERSERIEFENKRECVECVIVQYEVSIQFCTKDNKYYKCETSEKIDDETVGSRKHIAIRSECNRMLDVVDDDVETIENIMSEKNFKERKE